MSLTVNQIIDIITPQFSTDASFTNTITIATQRTSEEVFGENYNYAIALRTSHMLTLRDMNKNGVSSGIGAGAGAITSMSEGNTSISFGSLMNMTGTTGNKSGDLGLTRYGIELLGLIAGNICGFSVANYSNVKNNIEEEE
jgi:hypothetical protein